MSSQDWKLIAAIVMLIYCIGAVVTVFGLSVAFKRGSVETDAEGERMLRMVPSWVLIVLAALFWPFVLTLRVRRAGD